MSKLRFIIIIINAINIIFLLPLALVNYISFTIFLLISFVLSLIYLFVKRSEKIKLLKVSKIYLDDCDPDKYIIEYRKMMQRSLYSKNVKALNEITIALVHISKGDLNRAKDILDSLINEEPLFDIIIRFWYYKAWIYYFEETQEIEKIKVLIQQSKLLIDRSPIKFKAQLISNYNQIIARYYIASNIHLNLAEQEFNKVFKTNLPKFNVVINVYYLGVIAFKQKDYKHALEYFNSVVKNGNKLKVVEDAKEYIKLIENEIIE